MKKSTTVWGHLLGQWCRRGGQHLRRVGVGVALLLLHTPAQGQNSLPPAAVPAQPPTAAARLVVATGPVPVDEPLEVSVELTDAPLTQLGAFPELPGFKKTIRSRQTITRQIGQQVVVTLRITQQYLAFGEGDKTLPAFAMEVNGQPVRYGGGRVRITAAAPAAAPIGYGLADDLLGKPKTQEFREIADQARLFLEATPAGGAVWAGQGVRVRLFLTIAPEDQAVLEFAADFGRQMEQIRRALTPPDAWEEQAPALPTVPDTVRRPLASSRRPAPAPPPEEETRLRFLLHDAVYYPLSAGNPLRFPSVALRLVKYRLAKEAQDGADNRLATVKILTTQPVVVPVRPLPPHPLRTVVPVGVLRLTETLGFEAVRVGQPTRYRVEIAGGGNLVPVAFPDPLTKGPPGLAAYRAVVATTATWPPVGLGTAGGAKRFQWELVADRPGTYRLDSLVQLVYFDPVRGRYDTLRATRTLRVLPGTGRRPATSATGDAWADDPFYRRIVRESPLLPAQPAPADLRRTANMVLLLLALAGGWLVWQRHRPRSRERL